MKFSALLVNCAIVFVLLTFVSTEDAPKKTRRRKCRCKRYIEQLKKDIDERLTSFENKFDSLHFNATGELSDSPQSVKSDNSVEGVPLVITAEKFDRLIDRVGETKETLRKESYSLRVLQENMYTEDKNSDTLSATFKTLESVVTNISDSVERLEKTVQSSLNGLKHERKVRHRHTTIEQPLYPKGELTFFFIQSTV